MIKIFTLAEAEALVPFLQDTAEKIKEITKVYDAVAKKRAAAETITAKALKFWNPKEAEENIEALKKTETLLLAKAADELNGLSKLGGVLLVSVKPLCFAFLSKRNEENVFLVWKDGDVEIANYTTNLKAGMYKLNRSDFNCEMTIN